MARQWFEQTGSFAVDAWFRPSRLFLGSTVEGAIISCLITDRVLLRFSGFGVTTTGKDMQGGLNFKATQGANQATVSAPIAENVWQHFAAVYDQGGDGGSGACANPAAASCAPAQMLLYIGTQLVGRHRFPGPGPGNFFPYQDLTLGKHAPVPGAPASDGYFAGLMAEVRVWSRVLSASDVLYLAYGLYDAGQAQRAGMVARWPMSRDVCTPKVCRGTNQEWLLSDDGSSFFLGSSTPETKICLSVAVAAYGVSTSANGMLIYVDSCDTPNDYARWTSFEGTLMPADAASSQEPLCLAIPPLPPYDGAYALLMRCIYANTPANAHMRWTRNETTGQIRNAASGTCLTASSNRSRAGVFVIDCYQVAPGDRPLLAVEVNNEQHGTLRGGSGFLNASDFALGCCAPIDQAPRISRIGTTSITSDDQVVPAAATVDLTLTLDVYASDLNQNDTVILRMVTPPSPDATFAPRTDMERKNPVIYRFTWTPLYSTQWTNPAVALFEAIDVPINEFDPANPAPRGYSALATLSISTVTPPTLVFPTPAQYSTLVGDFGVPLNFQIRAESRNTGDVVRVIIAEGPAPGTDDAPTPPASRVVIGADQPSQFVALSGDIQFRLNPTTRSYTFTPAPEDAGRRYSVCFLGQVDGKQGLAGRTRLQCVFLYVPTTRPIYAAGSTENNTRIVSYAGCRVDFAVVSGKNDSSEAYTLSVTPRITLVDILDSPPRTTGPLPPGARFSMRGGPTGPAGAAGYDFAWEPQRGQEGNWTVCLDLADSLDITTVVRCVKIDIRKCLRCVQAGDTVQSIADLYKASWLELYVVNPQLHRRPDALAAGQIINVGVPYAVKRTQTLAALARSLSSSTAAVRGLNPDIPPGDPAVVTVPAAARLCILPPVCGPACAGSPACAAEWDRFTAIDIE